MKIIKRLICENCKFSSLHYCNKYNVPCPSFSFSSGRHQTRCIECIEENGYEEGNQENIKLNSTIACFHVPGPENFDLFKSIIKLQEFYPEVFYPNRKITEIYGSFGGAIWNGRTPDYGMTVLPIQEIDKLRIKAEELGLSINLTWNNHLVNGTDVFDRFCNAITKVFHNGKHAITVASPTLFEYLKNKYPNFKYYQSVISTTNDKNFIKKDERFDMYLMNRNLNNNWSELQKIPEEERGNIEFLCDDLCTPMCNRMGHYNIVNSCLLDRNDESCLGNYCTIDHDFSFYNMSNWPVTITPDMIDTYIENNYRHFKISGRGDGDCAILLRLLPYLIKPQYFSDAFIWAISRRFETEEKRKNKVK